MARKLRAAVVVAVAVGLSGCWYAPGQGPNRAAHNPFETGITTETVDDLAVQWVADTDAGGVDDPVVSDVGVHVSDGSLSYYGFDRRTGAREWKHTRGPDGVPLSIATGIAQGDRLLVGSGRGNLGGFWDADWLDAATGQIESEPGGAGLADGVRGSTIVFRRIAFGSGTPVLTTLQVTDPENPAIGWAGNILITNGTAAAVTLGPAGVYQAGQGILDFSNPGSPTFGHGVRAWPLTQPAQCGPSNSFACPMWATPIDGTGATTPVLGPGETTLYTVSNVGTLHAVRAADGAVLWTAPLGAAPTDAPALADGILYVPAADGRLVAFAADGCGAATCGSLWAATGNAGARISEQPAVAGGVVFTGWSDGTVHAHDAAGCGAAICTPVWSAIVGSPISGAPAVTGGQLYVGTQDGRLVAYGLD